MSKALGQAAERNRGVSTAVLETVVVPSCGAPGITPAPRPQRRPLSSVARATPGITRAPLPSRQERPWRHLHSPACGEVDTHSMQERVNQANATLQWPTPAIPWNTPVRPRSPSVGSTRSRSRSRSPLRRRPAVHLQPAKASGKGRVGRGRGAGKAMETPAREARIETPAGEAGPTVALVSAASVQHSPERSTARPRPSPGRGERSSSPGSTVLPPGASRSPSWIPESLDSRTIQR